MLRTSLELKKDVSEDTVSTELNYLGPSAKRNRASVIANSIVSGQIHVYE